MQFYYDVREKIGGHRQSGFDYVFEYLKGVDKPLIIETGCARQEDNYFGDGQSSLLFDKYVQEYGGEFYTVDISTESIEYCRSKVSTKTTVVQEDSITFLKELNQSLLKQNKKIDFLYLDSFDAPRDQPEVCYQSAMHHLYELLTIAPSLKQGALIGVDDNWVENKDNLHMLMGKGQLIFDYMRKVNNPLVKDGYQMFWKY